MPGKGGSAPSVYPLPGGWSDFLAPAFVLFYNSGYLVHLSPQKSTRRVSHVRSSVSHLARWSFWKSPGALKDRKPRCVSGSPSLSLLSTPNNSFFAPALNKQWFPFKFSPFHALFTTKLTFSRHLWHMTYYSSQLKHTLFTRNTRQPVSNPLLQRPRPGQLPLSPP